MRGARLVLEIDDLDAARVPGVGPGVALPHHLEVHVDAVDVHLADAAAVVIDIHHLDASELSERVVRERGLRAAAVGLAQLGRVDLREADLDGPLVHQERERVAVADAHDPALEQRRRRGGAGQRGEQKHESEDAGEGGHAIRLRAADRARSSA